MAKPIWGLPVPVFLLEADQLTEIELRMFSCHFMLPCKFHCPRDTRLILNRQFSVCCKWQTMVRSQLFTYLINPQEIVQQLLNKKCGMVLVFGDTVFNLNISHWQEVMAIHGRPITWQQFLGHQESHNMASQTPLIVTAFESYSCLKTTTGQERTERHREMCIISSIFIQFLSICESHSLILFLQ